MPFQPLPSNGVPRRAFLLMPLAVGGGIAALAARKPRPTPDPAQAGSGAMVTVVLFTDTGERQATTQVAKLVKPDSEWKKELSAEEFAVTRQKGTERAFTGRYWNTHDRGLYRCVCCGTALFRSNEKFDSGTGWPSFWAPIAKENVRNVRDATYGMERVEVECAKCDAHLGHVFNDGPPPTGLRYCMNSVSLKFVKG